MIENNEIAELVSKWEYGCCLLEVEDRYGADVVLTFDHDYQFHILIREWYMKDPGHVPVYSLWFIGNESTCLVKRWVFENVEPFPPLIESAKLVSDWVTLSREYWNNRGYDEI